MKILISLTFLILFPIGCATQSALPQFNDDVTTQNKKLVSEFFEHFSNGEIDDAFAIVDDDVSWWVPGDLPFSGTKSKAEYLQVVGSIQRGFPNGLQLKATSMIAEGNKVAVEVESYGEHVNGRKYINKYHFLITIEGGKMIEVREYMDTLHLYQLIQP